MCARFCATVMQITIHYDRFCREDQRAYKITLLSTIEKNSGSFGTVLLSMNNARY
jgi:hypothetical protein